MLRILGPVEAWSDGGWQVPGSPQLRLVLGLLAFQARQAVHIDQLIDALWDDHPPRSARNSLQVLLTHLRKVVAATPGLGLMRSGNSFRLDVDPAAVDLHRFRTLARVARDAQDGWTSAAAYDEALSLWRGPALADAADTIRAGQIRDGLAEEYVSVREERIGALLASGRHAEAAAEIPLLVSERPLREKPAGMLMLALYRCGRQADALAVFRGTRDRLIAELGIEPGPELQRLHQQILAGDPGLLIQPQSHDDQLPGGERCSGGSRPDPAGSVVPRQLPPPIPHFAARRAELDRMSGLLDEMAEAGNTVVILAVGGTAGVGKTALALQFAHQVAERFPDGQLYANLRGYDPSGVPLTPDEAVRRFLDGLQVPPWQIPASLDAQAGLYRSLLADRQMLIVLDNAREEQQVRPLLPGAPGSLVIITSRSQLTGLIAADGAHTFTLDLLTRHSARELLSRQLGAERVAAEPHAVGKLIESCARLPLALAVTAARAATRPGFPLAALAADLCDMRGRLDLLDTRDPATSLRPVFSWSYESLGPLAARMFRLLGLHPGLDASAHAAASLVGASLRQAHQALGELTEAHLLTEHAPGRYAFHDLLRAYASELAEAHDDDADQRAALHRMLDHYLHTAHAAALLRDPAREPLPIDEPQSGTTLGQMADERQALSWLKTEHRVLAAAIPWAASAGFHGHAWQLAWALGGFLDRYGYWKEWHAILTIALAAAEHHQDRSGQAHIHRDFGFALCRLGRHQDARAHLEKALELFAQLGDRRGQAHAQLNIGTTFAGQDRYDTALRHARQALELLRAGGRQTLLANALNNIGWYHVHLGNFQQAVKYCQQSLAVHRGIGNGADGEAAALSSLGYAHQHLGHLAEAIAYYRQALEVYGVFGSRYEEAKTFKSLGDAQQAMGNMPAARDSWQRALSILDGLHHPDLSQVRAKLCAPGAEI